MPSGAKDLHSKHEHESPDLDQNIREFSTQQPLSLINTEREADKHLFGEGMSNSLSPTALDADYARMQADAGDSYDNDE